MTQSARSGVVTSTCASSRITRSARTSQNTPSVANHGPATILKEAIKSIPDKLGADGAAVRVVVGVDDALERMRALGRGRHFYLFIRSPSHPAQRRSRDRIDQPRRRLQSKISVDQIQATRTVMNTTA